MKKNTLLAMMAAAAALVAQAETIEFLTNGERFDFAEWGVVRGWSTDSGIWTSCNLSDGNKYIQVYSKGFLCTLSQTVALADFGITANDLQSANLVVTAFVKARCNGKGSEVNNVKVYQLDATEAVLSTHEVMNSPGAAFDATDCSLSITLNADARKLKYELNAKCYGDDDAFIPGPLFRSSSLKISWSSVTFVSMDATVGSVAYAEGGTGATAPVPTRNGDYVFFGYFTEDGTQVFDASGALVPGSLSGLSSKATLYARWGAPEGSIAKLVYRGQLNLLTGEPAVHDTTYEKKMHFRVYDGSEATTPLWQIDNQDVTVNADGSFVHAFGDETLAALIATGKVTHVGVAIGPSAGLATELKPRRELRPVAAVNRALTAEGAALDIRIGNLVTENALVAADATVSQLEVAGRVTAPGAGKVSVSPLTVGPEERTRLMRGSGVKAFSREKPQELSVSPSGAVQRGQVLAVVPADGIALISSKATGERALRCPAVVQYCRKGEDVRAPTSDPGGLKVTFFPFVGKEGR